MGQWDTLQQSVFNIRSKPHSLNGCDKQSSMSFLGSDPLSAEDDVCRNDEYMPDNCTALYRLLGSSFSGTPSTNSSFSREDTNSRDDIDQSEEWITTQELHATSANRSSRGLYADAASVVLDNRIQVDGRDAQSATFPQLLLHGFSRDSICISPTWSDVAYQVHTEDDTPAGRFGHTAVLFKREMYVFGGKGESGYLNDVLCYELDSAMWRRYVPSPLWTSEEKKQFWPCPRSCHAATLVGDRMYVLSGEFCPQKCVPDMWSFHFETKTWTLESSVVPFAPRKGHTMHFLSRTDTAERSTYNMLVVFGGVLCDGLPSNDVFLYNLDLKRWSKLRTSGDVPAPRSFHVSQLVDQTSQLLVFGGRTALPSQSSSSNPTPSTQSTPEANYLNDLFILDVSTGRWVRKQGPEGSVWPFPLSCCTSVFANGVFAVFCGGNNARCCTMCYEYHVGSGEWKTVAIARQPVCSRPTVVYAGNQLVLFGGCTSGGCLLSKTLKLALPPLSLRDSCGVWLRRSVLQRKLLASTYSHYRNQKQRQQSFPSQPSYRTYGAGDYGRSPYQFLSHSSTYGGPIQLHSS